MTKVAANTLSQEVPFNLKVHPHAAEENIQPWLK